MKTVGAFAGALLCLVGAVWLESLLLLLAGMCLIIYGLIEGLDA